MKLTPDRRVLSSAKKSGVPEQVEAALSSGKCDTDAVDVVQEADTALDVTAYQRQYHDMVLLALIRVDCH